MSLIYTTGAKTYNPIFIKKKKKKNAAKSVKSCVKFKWIDSLTEAKGKTDYKRIITYLYYNPFYYIF